MHYNNTTGLPRPVPSCSRRPKLTRRKPSLLYIWYSVIAPHNKTRGVIASRADARHPRPAPPRPSPTPHK